MLVKGYLSPTDGLLMVPKIKKVGKHQTPDSSPNTSLGCLQSTIVNFPSFSF